MGLTRSHLWAGLFSRAHYLALVHFLDLQVELAFTFMQPGFGEPRHQFDRAVFAIFALQNFTSPIDPG